MKKPIEKSRKMPRMFTSVPHEVKAKAEVKAKESKEAAGNVSAWLRILIEKNV